jgi:hypothetical protein
MVCKLDANDFRAARYVLEPDDFALSDGPDRPPTDLIDETAWRGIMDLPGDVAIRTTSYQGKRAAILHDLLGAWVEAMPEKPDIVADGMSDAADNFQAATFNLVHGFYKEAIAALRSALETMTFAVSCQLSNNEEVWQRWRDGNELSFGRQCDRAQKLPPLDLLERRAREVNGTSIFAGQDGSGRNAWARNLYRRLSEYVHARGTNTSLWKSNGPIYSAQGFALSYHFFLETFALTFILAKVALPTLSPGAAHHIFTDENRKHYLDAVYCQVCGLYVERLF